MALCKEKKSTQFETSELKRSAHMSIIQVELLLVLQDMCCQYIFRHPIHSY